MQDALSQGSIDLEARLTEAQAASTALTPRLVRRIPLGGTAAGAFLGAIICTGLFASVEEGTAKLYTPFIGVPYGVVVGSVLGLLLWGACVLVALLRPGHLRAVLARVPTGVLTVLLTASGLSVWTTAGGYWGTRAVMAATVGVSSYVTSRVAASWMLRDHVDHPSQGPAAPPQ